MADTTTSNLLLTKPEVGASTDTWGTKINSDLDTIDAVFKADGTGTSVGLNVGSGKTLNVAGTMVVTGAASTIDGTAIGSSTPDSGAFTTLSASGNITASAGTANGVAYLNGSKVLTTGSAMTFDGANLGIGTSSPSYRLHVVSATENGAFVSDGTRSFSIINSSAAGGPVIGAYSNHPLLITTNNTERARISAAGGFSVGTTSDPGAGAIYATGNITAYFSDNRLKTRLGGIENALDKVEKLSGFYYEANETAQALGYKPKREVGVSAQEVQAVLPEVVSPAPVDQQYLTVDYERLVPLLIEAIKELRAEVQALKVGQ